MRQQFSKTQNVIPFFVIMLFFEKKERYQMPSLYMYIKHYERADTCHSRMYSCTVFQY